MSELAEREVPDVTFSGIQVLGDDEVRQVSSLGTPIWHPITLRGGLYKRYATSGSVEEVQLAALRLPISSISEMSMTKVITKTQVSASGATVKEVYSNGDWEIRLSGILLDERSQPNGASSVETMEERMLEFAELADSIGVDSDIYNRRGIDRLVIRSVSFTQIPGRPRMIGYQMQCESDAPLELLIR
ncbi:MAG: hypothetical protein KIT10_14600 [Flavobacteriales bacterium]|nr:hypothetical protein [Flavobacteriales bacterium]